MLFWKHKKEGHVLLQDCYQKLDRDKQMEYYMTTQPASHKVVENDDDTMSILPIVAAASLLSNDDATLTTFPDVSYTPTDDSSFDGSSSDSGGTDFGGGDFGGGGSSDSY